MWNNHLQEVIDKLVTRLQEMPPEKLNSVLTFVAKKLDAGQLHQPKHSLMHPGHEWILPQGDLKRVPYVPPIEQKVPEQRVHKQRVTLKDGEPAKNVPPQLPTLACITNAPPNMLAPNPTTRRALQLTKCKHSQRTQNTIPGSAPLIANTAPRHHVPHPLPDILIATTP
jgi:hypothetical protein